jgi:hypothetical protein
VAIAEARAAAAGGEDHETWCYRQQVARLAKHRFDILRRVDTATRYDIVDGWARRPGQMIDPIEDRYVAQEESSAPSAP